MSFQFNFRDSPSSSRQPSPELEARPPTPIKPLPTSLTPQFHSFTSLIKSLPTSLAYSRLSPPLSLPRRPLFDTKLQAFSQRELPDEDSAVHLGLHSPSDLQKGKYEGGFKTWEGSLDLATYLLENAPIVGSGEDGLVRSVELGAGAAIPSCLILKRALEFGRKARIVVQDFNKEVLELVTMPNLLLTWLDYRSRLGKEAEGDIEIHEALIKEFLQDMESRGIEIGFISGGWGLEMSRILDERHVVGGLVMAAETIYQTESLPYFLDTTLKGIRQIGTALVAAKEVYFGVGGNVGEFIDAVKRRGAKPEIKWKGGEGGVGRVIVEVKNI